MKKKKKKLEVLRHSTAHLLAAAVGKLYPGTKFGIGPVIEDGFYYDFDSPHQFSPKDFPKIEKKMRELAQKNLPFLKEELSLEEAIKLFKDLKQDYKVELLEEIQEYGTTKIGEPKKGLKKSPRVSLYQTGDFIDLCRGPHLKSSQEIKAFKLTKVAGAYWRGDERNKMLQRIYGTAFFSQEELKKYLKKKEEREKRDHRKIGQELDLFHLDEKFGQGLPLWHPKGAILAREVENFVLEEYLKRGYLLLRTPHLAKLDLFKISGHWDFFRENIYPSIKIEEEEYIVKPMNCPGHILIFKSHLWSYRDLPLRYTELGTVYRYERSGVLHGLTRVRGFTQDDAHIFCRPEQLERELKETIKLTKYILKTFKFKEFKISLSVRDPRNKEKYLGNDEIWQLAEKALEEAIKDSGWEYEREEGEAAFYGPKIDILVQDSLGREWQISTIQVDFNLPERFRLEYVEKGGEKRRPVMIHRALLGSIERFLGILIEHFAGVFPLWLAPLQIYIIPVGSRHKKSSQKLAAELKELSFRVQIDELNETVGYKIRKAEKQKIPYILVIGDKEAKGRKLTIRERGRKRLVEMSKKKFIEELKKRREKKN